MFEMEPMIEIKVDGFGLPRLSVQLLVKFAVYRWVTMLA